MIKQLENLVSLIKRGGAPEREQFTPLDNMQIADGVIVDLREQASEAGFDQVQIRSRETRLYEKGLTPYGVQFERPITLASGSKSSIAMIPVDFEDATLKDMARDNIGKPASVVMTTDHEIRTSVAIGLTVPNA